MPRQTPPNRFTALRHRGMIGPPRHKGGTLAEVEHSGPGKLILPVPRRRARQHLAENHLRLKERRESGGA
jgi:hypothetical protein